MGDIMVVLAREWKIGYVIFSILGVLIYLVFSINLVTTSRKEGYDIGVSGMIPLWNIVVLIKKKLFIAKKNKEARLLEEVIDL